MIRSPLAARTIAWAVGMPLPGAGHTRERFARLHAAAAEDPPLGRLVEAHADALAILDEAGRPDTTSAAMLGVWAARGAVAPVLAREGARWRVRATAPWCSGAGLVDAALVVADHDGRSALVRIEMDDPGATLREPDWMSPAFVATDTRTVEFDVVVSDDAIIGADGWYVARPGFWHGAVGVAACWAGCAAGLIARLRPTWRTDPHAAAHLGAVDALLWQLRAVLDTAADEIDARPADASAAHVRALRVRHLVDVSVAEISDRAQRALGPAPMAMMPSLHRILAECDLYRRQCHAERDLEALGRLVGAARPAG